MGRVLLLAGNAPIFSVSDGKGFTKSLFAMEKASSRLWKGVRIDADLLDLLQKLQKRERQEDRGSY